MSWPVLLYPDGTVIVAIAEACVSPLLIPNATCTA